MDERFAYQMQRSEEHGKDEKMAGCRAHRLYDALLAAGALVGCLYGGGSSEFG